MSRSTLDLPQCKPTRSRTHSHTSTRTVLSVEPALQASPQRSTQRQHSGDIHGNQPGAKFLYVQLRRPTVSNVAPRRPGRNGGNQSLTSFRRAGLNSSNTLRRCLPDGLRIPDPPAGGSTSFVTFFATVTSGSQSTGQWFEVPYTTGTSPQLTLTNYTSSNETLSNVGYMLSPTLIPLDNLNYGTLPPPGTPGSPFSSLPGYDGSMLTGGDGKGGAGGTITTYALPEPASVISFRHEPCSRGRISCQPDVSCPVRRPSRRVNSLEIWSRRDGPGSL